MDAVLQDIRYGFRLLLRRPAFAAVAALTLALGVGANTAIFSVVNAVLLKPLPYGDPDRLAVVWSRWKGFDKTWLSEAELKDYREQMKSFAGVGAWSGGAVNLTGGGPPERIAAADVTADLFDVLGVTPILGRTFTKEEDQPGRNDAVIIGHALWRRRFAMDPSVVGRSMQVDGAPRTIVGVMPQGFRLPLDYQEEQPTEAWMPAGLEMKPSDRGNHGLNAAARLAPGATFESANAELHTLTSGWTEQGLYPRPMEFQAIAVPMAQEILGTVRTALIVLSAAVGLLLLIACANVANLLLARAEERQREIAMRTALGARRGRIIRQLLVEGGALCSIGGLLGLLFAFAGVRVLSASAPANIPRLADVSIDWRVLAFTALVSAAASLLFGLAPALHAGAPDLAAALKDGNQSSTAGSARQRFRHLTAASELAIAVMLLVGAALMIKSLWALQRIDPGFRAERVLTLHVTLPQEDYRTPESTVTFFQRTLDRVRALPGVTSAGFVRSLPLASSIGDWGLRIEGYTPPPGENAKGDWQIATSGYLEAMGERLVRGRFFSDADTASAPLIAIVNETMARAYWPNDDPIGRRFSVGGNPRRPLATIVGVVGDVRHNGITTIIKEKFYIPHAQWSVATTNTMRGMTLVVRAASDPLALTPSIRREIAAIDPNLPIANVRTMDQVLAATTSEPRFTGMLLLTFAALALSLAAVGIYGVLSYLVSLRTREIGVRIALGAEPAQVVALVMRRGVTLAAAGVAAGVLGALAAARLMSSLLYGVTTTDLASFTIAPLALFAVAIVASYIPARRATRVDPLTALRSE